jgi:2-polyprenyl-3-methyl-5-hydroxy-6-metoxy-1,4-benzoquinol methylase
MKEDLLTKGWEKVAVSNINIILDYISSGSTLETFEPSTQYFNLLGNIDQNLNILDFGCGVGRNTFGLANHFKNSNIVGYDLEKMISRIDEYKKLKFGETTFSNVNFEFNWDNVKVKKFDCIFSCIVFQHLSKESILKYISDFKNMTNRLIIIGRRINDDFNMGNSTWKLIEDSIGFPPTQFYDELLSIVPYKPFGTPEEHHCAIYVW